MPIYIGFNFLDLHNSSFACDITVSDTYVLGKYLSEYNEDSLRLQIEVQEVLTA